MTAITESAENAFNTLDVRCLFVRGRNALVTRADFGPLYEDYYLHWMQHGIRFPALADDMLKDALAALVLHLAARPQDEVVAWTVNFQKPLLSLFVTGATRPGNVVGRVWLEGVRVGPQGLFCSDTRSVHAGQRRSNVDFDSGDFFRAVEEFYERSEQRKARLFRCAPEEFVLITAQPECDLEWLNQLDDAMVRAMENQETLSPLEVRRYHFDCGCTAERMVERLSVLSGGDLHALFEEASTIRVDCPRCGAIFELERSQFRGLSD